MADSFDDRRKGFEEKFRMDQELQFKVLSRRDKLLGMWFGEKLGLSGQPLSDYAGSVIAAAVQKPGDDDVVSKIMTDVARHNIGVTEAEIRTKLAELAQTAKSQIDAELK